MEMETSAQWIRVETQRDWDGKVPEHEDSHEDHGVEPGYRQKFVFGELPCPSHPPNRRDEPLDVKPGPLLSLPFRHQPGCIDLRIPWQIPEYRVEHKEQDAQAEVDADRGKQRGEDHYWGSTEQSDSGRSTEPGTNRRSRGEAAVAPRATSQKLTSPSETANRSAPHTGGRS